MGELKGAFGHIRNEELASSQQPFPFDLKHRICANHDLFSKHELFENMIENSTVGFFLLDTEGDIVYSNPVIHTLTEYSRDEIRGKNICHLTHLEDSERMIEDFLLLQSDQHILESKIYRLSMISDRIRYVETHIHPIWKGTEKCGYLGSMIDATEKKRLFDEQFLLKSIAEMVPDAIIVATPNFEIIYINKATEELYGYRLEEIYLKSPRCLLAPVVSEPSIQMMKEAILSGQTGRSETLHQRKDGSVFFCDYRISPIFENGQIRYFIGVHHDITEKVQTRERLVAGEEKYRSLVEQSNDGICIVHDMIIFFANKQLTKICGYPLKEMIEAPILNFVVPEERSKVNRHFKEFFSGEVNEQRYETIFLHQSGSRVHVDINLRDLDFDGDRAANMVIRDVTQKRKMEQEIVNHQKFESLGILAGGIAHDFNNMFMAIMGHLNIIRLHAKGNDRVLSNTRKAESIIMQAKETTNQLITFSLGSVHSDTFLDIAAAIKTVLDRLGITPEIILTLSLPDDLWAIEIDETLFHRVMHNLAINAIEALPDGGVIKISGENISISESASVPLTPGEYIKISIMDSGTGIPEENISRVFDPFFTTKKNGQGLGLPICWSVINRYHGHIQVQSRPGSGSTFYFYLPRYQQAETTNHSISWGDATRSADSEPSGESGEKQSLSH